MIRYLNFWPSFTILAREWVGALMRSKKQDIATADRSDFLMSIVMFKGSSLLKIRSHDDVSLSEASGPNDR